MNIFPRDNQHARGRIVSIVSQEWIYYGVISVNYLFRSIGNRFWKAIVYIVDLDYLDRDGTFYARLMCTLERVIF